MFGSEGYIVLVGRVHCLCQKGTLFVSKGYIVCVTRVHYFGLEGAVGYSFRHSFKARSLKFYMVVDLHNTNRSYHVIPYHTIKKQIIPNMAGPLSHLTCYGQVQSFFGLSSGTHLGP